jgi:hypothetical protein
MYQYEHVYTDICTYQYVLLCTSSYTYIQIHTSIYWYIPLCTGMYWYISLVFTLFSGAEGLGCVLLATQPPQSHTSLESTGVRSSPWDVQTLQLQMAGVASMCMRSSHVVVELWPWQATPGWSDGGGDCSQEENWEEGPSQAFCAKSWAQEGGWRMIK